MSFFYIGGNVLDSEAFTENRGNTEASEAEAFSQEIPHISLKSREIYGRYFGICSSYHHLKACVCKTCPSYPGGTGIFCARGNNEGEGKKEGCLCETCELFKKFRLEGEYFCQPKEKLEGFESTQPPLNICTNFRTSAGTIRVCVLDNRDMHSK